MKQKKIKLKHTMKSAHSEVSSEFVGFAIKEIDGHSITYFYTENDVRTFVCVEKQSVALMRIDDGMTAVWLNENKEGLLFKTSSMGELKLNLELEKLYISDEDVELSYHLIQDDQILDTITLTWEEL
ncbi:MAG: DUF1934 family protein [Erysipelothrix sp.]|jgi:uncharacterized beta-barrel protein YwiB (DUF1934 family)|nr:DUF1934 family protein [Erysipelothrix sp.]